MKTKRLTAKMVSENSGISEKLVRAVLRQLGGGAEAWDSLRDVAGHGADGGFGGFIYYTDTVGFFKRYRAEIVELARRMADDLGEGVVEMVAGFNCLGGQRLRGRFGASDSARKDALAEYIDSAGRCIYGGRLTDDDTNVANALAWFALEEVARAAEDCRE